MSLGSQGSFFLGSSGQGGGGYAIERSLRFNPGDSAYLSKQYTTSGNRRKATISMWLKRGNLANNSGLFLVSDNATSTFSYDFDTDDTIRLYFNNGAADLNTSAVFRDASAWYHLTLVIDTANATSSDRIKIYVNGVNQTLTGTFPSQNSDTELGLTGSWVHTIGRHIGGSEQLDGYLADIHFIDGQALAPTDFGKYDSNSVWQPKEFAGTYGTNGFKLDFSDISSNAALGTDSSGNSNTWTVNNLNAAGLDMDQSQTWSTYGSPSSGGFALPASRGFNGNTANQTEGDTTGAYFSIPYSATVAVGGVGFFTYASGSTGKMKVYNGATLVETVDSSTGGSWRYTSSYSGAITEIRISRDSRAFEFAAVSVNGKVLVDAGVPDPLGATIDALRDTPVNGDSSDDTGAGGEITGNYATLNPLVKTSTTVLANGNLDVTSTGQLNAVSTFVPSSGKWYWEVQLGSIVTNSFIGLYGTTPLNSTYLSYGINGYGFLNTGWGSASSTISGTGVAGDFIGLALDVDAKTLEYYKNGSSIGTISGFTFVENWSFGISCNVTVSTPWVFNFGQRAFAYAAPTNYKALCTANLPDPTIADGSTAFEVSTWSGTGSAQSITTNMSPDLVWVKDRGPTPVSGHKLEDIVRGAGKYLSSNTAGAEVSPSDGISSFNANGYTLGTDNAYNGTGHSYVGWAWDAGSSTTTIAAGSLNSSVYDQSQTWSSGSTSGTIFSGNFGQVFNGVITNTYSDGNSAYVYQNSATYTFPSALTGTIEVWIRAASNGASGDNVTVTDGTTVYSTGDITNQTAAYVSLNNGNSISGITSITLNSGGSSQSGIVLGAIKLNGKMLVDSGVTPPNFPSIASTVRANPSAGFSIVSYTGAGAATTVSHNLGATPSFIIIKDRDAGQDWAVWHASLPTPTTGFLSLNLTDSGSNSAAYWNSTAPTNSVFSLGTAAATNTSGNNMIAYCFAPVEQYSSFGSYLGNGSADGPFVFTGFRPRWILLKNITNAYSWYLYDTARGTFNVVETALFPNSAGEDTVDAAYAIDILSNGFKLRNLNIRSNGSSNTYMYAAFAENPQKYSRAR